MRRNYLLAILLLIIGLGTLILINLKTGDKHMKNEIKDFKTEIFGDNVYIFSPDDQAEEVQKILDDLWKSQETNEFGKERYACYFMPGQYNEDISVMVGFYMHVGGLGLLPSDTLISNLNCDAKWRGDANNHNGTCNFWRGVENLNVEKDVMWAVSQATFMRRMQLDNSLYLHDDNGWVSGGFLADSKIGRLVDSGTQQQWLSRNSDWSNWLGQNWNMVFVGLEVGDNFWIWRADHGEQVGWDINVGENGIIVNGDDVTIYGLFVEHFNEYQTIWNGNGGRTYFYQSEIPYDVPKQESWMSNKGSVNGYASYKVGDQVTSHEAWGLGIYSFHRDAQVDLHSAMEIPDRQDVVVNNVCTVMITGNPGISNIINDSGKEVITPGARQVIVKYENGEFK